MCVISSDGRGLRSYSYDKKNRSSGRVDLGDLLKCNLGLKIFHCPVSISVGKPETLCEAVNYDY